MQQPARRHTCDHDAFCRQLFSQRRIDAGRYKVRLSAWQLVLDLTLDGIRTDGHLSDAAFGDQLFEPAEWDRVELLVGYPDPWQNKRTNRDGSHDGDCDPLFS